MSAYELAETLKELLLEDGRENPFYMSSDDKGDRYKAAVTEVIKRLQHRFDKNMPKEVVTVGDLRAALSYSEDEEPVVFDLKEDTVYGQKTVPLKCSGVGSSGGGRITVLWLDKKNYPKDYLPKNDD
jgi:hypothetical protein